MAKSNKSDPIFDFSTQNEVTSNGCLNTAPPVSSNAQPTKLNKETEFSSPDKVNSNLVNEDCIGLHQTKFEDNEAPKQMSVYL